MGVGVGKVMLSPAVCYVSVVYFFLTDHSKDMLIHDLCPPNVTSPLNLCFFNQ